MNIWDILKIEETKDKDKLKSAYRTLLTKVNPEDDPEGFMELRRAYEEAVKLADVKDDKNDGSGCTPLDELLNRIKEIYNDFNSRIDVSVWQELFNSDIYVSLESSDKSFDVLMKFLMGNFYLPQKIWKLIRETFDFDHRKKEYAETYPEEFIDYVINNSTYDDILNYYLFDGDMDDVDKYIEKYYKLDYEIRRHNIDKQNDIIDELEQFDIYHPYFEISKITNQIQKLGEDVNLDELSLYQNEIEQLLADFSDDLFVVISCGDVAMARKDYKRARECYDKASFISPDNYMVKGKLADVSYYEGEYEKSRDLYLDLLKINHYDNNVRAGMIRANYAIIEEHKEKLVQNPEDNKIRIEMAWCYYQSLRFEEAVNILSEFEPDDEQKCEYYNVKGRSYLCMLNYEKARECFFVWVDEISKIPDDDNSEDAVKRKKRYPYANFLIADCFLKTKQFDEARKYLEIALLNEHEEILLSYEALCELEYETGNYEACIDACEKLKERDQRNYIAFSYLAKACLKLDYIKESMSASEKAISIYPFICEPYVNEIKIFLRYNQTDQARQVIGRYKQLNLESDKIDYFEAVIVSSEGKYKEAISMFEDLEDKINPDDTDLEDINNLYMEMGYCYEKTEDVYSAKKCYEKVIANDPFHKRAHGCIAFIYKNKKQYDKALEEFDKQIDINPNAYYYINRAILCKLMGKPKNALLDYFCALKMEPYNCFCLSRIGQIYENDGDFEKAVEFYNKTLECVGENDNEIKKQTLEGLARVLQCTNSFKESKETYERFFEEFGLLADVAYDYAELLYRMQNMDEAVNFLMRCINELEYSSDVQMCIRQLCYIYGREGYIDKAYESFQLAISKDKNDAKAYANMGEIFINARLYDDAIQMYLKATEIDKDNKNNYYSRLVEATVLRRGLFKPELKNYIKKAYISEENLRYSLNCVKMVRLNRLTKKYQDAISIADMALKQSRCYMCPYGRCHEALYEKGLVYEAMKDYEKARVCYLEALKVCGHNPVYEEKLKRIEGK